jgi:hypothetical protein
MAATDEKGRQWSYLASDEKYQAQGAGTMALKKIAEYLNRANVKTSVFYTSNVEQSLRGQAWQQFYRNIELLPFDSHSLILRAISSDLVPTPCSAQGLLGSFQNNTRQAFDPGC